MDLSRRVRRRLSDQSPARTRLAVVVVLRMFDRTEERRQILQATDLVALIGEHVALRPRGKEFVGLCPFHEDHSPSLNVSPSKQIYKCFVCQEGGTAFDFVMKYHKMTFVEALKYLAERAGIVLQSATQQGVGPSPRQRLLEANAFACRFFQRNLADETLGQEARAYIRRRGISDAMVEQFQIGYAPEGWDNLVKAAARQKMPVTDLLEAGLVQKRQNADGYYDRMRHRLIFPICDHLGRPVAFGGRKMREEDNPKYLNSPSTPVFDKSSTLYGLHLVKKAGAALRRVIIVEGYTDVIACHQAGATNVAAVMGTALTLEHVKSLRLLADQAVLIYDADGPGQDAAERVLEICLTGAMDVAVATLPEGLDPADLFLQPDGKARWDQSVAAAIDALEYQFQRMCQAMGASSTVTGQERIIEDYLRRLANIGFKGISPVRRSLLMQRLATMLRLSEHDLTQMLNQLTPVRRPTSPRSVQQASEPEPPAESLLEQPEAPVPPPAADDQRRALELAQRQVLAALWRKADLFHETLPGGEAFDEALPPEIWPAGPLADAYRWVYEQIAGGAQPILADLLIDLASRGQSDQGPMLTEADREMDQAAGDDMEQVGQTFREAAAFLVKHQRENRSRQLETRLRSGITRGSVPADQARALQELIEHWRATPSTTRIVRKAT